MASSATKTGMTSGSFISPHLLDEHYYRHLPIHLPDLPKGCSPWQFFCRRRGRQCRRDADASCLAFRRRRDADASGLTLKRGWFTLRRCLWLPFADSSCNCLPLLLRSACRRRGLGSFSFSFGDVAGTTKALVTRRHWLATATAT